MASTAALLRDPLAAAILGLHDTPGRGYHTAGGSTLHVDFFEAEAAYTLLADMPGLGQDDVKLELQNRTLVLSGGDPSRPASPKQGKADDGAADDAMTPAHFASLRRRTYRRALQLPNDVDEAAIGASMDRGVLVVTLPKRKSAMPRQIAVSGPSGSGKNAAAAV